MSTTSHTRSHAFLVLQRMFDEGFSTGNGALVDELCSPDLVEHQFGMTGTGAEAIRHVKDAIRDVHRAVPDIAFTIEDAVESGDTIWVRARAQGTASGPFFGPPSGRRLDFTVVESPASSAAASSSTGACPTASPCSPRPASSTGRPEPAGFAPAARKPPGRSPLARGE